MKSRFAKAILLTTMAVAPAAQIRAQVQRPEAAPVAADFDRKAAKIDELFAAEEKKGGSFLMRYDVGSRNFSKGYGYLDCARTRPMRTDALFDSGSLTKTFTYAAIYKLVEEGRLKLDDTLDVFFRDLPADKRRITVAQLLDHQSGLPDFLGLDGRQPAEDPEVIVNDYLPVSKEQMLKSAFASTLLFPPGTKQKYSNLGFQLLAAIIEKQSGQDYEKYVREKILLPAGMKDTGYRLPDFSGKVFVEECKGDTAWGDPVSKGLWKKGVSWNLIGAGGMMTTLDDLKRWTEAMTSGKLFRPDIQQRFRRIPLFIAAYEQCGTEVLGLAGSNVLTFAGIIYLPLRRETMIMASTRSGHNPPQRELIPILCGR